MDSKVYQGQNLSDKAIEMTGTIDTVFALALENSLSITDALSIGTVLNYSGRVIKPIASLFGNNNRCATGITTEQNTFIIPDDGIGAMIIEETLIVR